MKRFLFVVLLGIAGIANAQNINLSSGDANLPNTTYGTASGSDTFTVSGTALTSDITITPSTTGLEVSLSSSSGYASSLSLTPTSGTVSTTTIYVRIAATAIVANYQTGTVDCASAGATTLTKDIGDSNATVLAKNLTITGIAGDNKVYDQTTAASVSGSPSLVGVLGSEDVHIDASSATFSFADAAAGNAKSITVTGFAITGSDIGNYILVQPTGLTGDITQIALTIDLTGVTGNNKVFDNTTAATLTGSAVLNPGVLSGDDVALSAPGATFAQTDVGSALVINTSYTLTGAQAGNYSISQPTGLTADITPETLTITGISISPKVYDNTATATIAGTAALSGVLAGGVTLNTGSAVATFTTVAVNTGIPVTISGYSIAGTNSGNYTLSQPTGLTGNITPATLTITGISINNKVFDNTTSATITGTPNLVGVIAGGVTLGGSPSATFNTAAVGTSKPITLSGYSISGANAGNYSLTQPTGLTANITQKPITIVGISINDKVFDNTPSATIAGTASLVGVIAGGVTLNTGSATASFTASTVANAIPVTVSGYSISGAQAANYSLTQPTGLTANITPATLTITGISINNKEFDTTTSATITGTPNLVGVIAGGVNLLTGSAVATFTSSAVANDIPVIVSGYSINGPQSGNYSLIQPTGLTANITSPTFIALATTGVAASPIPTSTASVGSRVALLGFSAFNQDASVDVTSLTLSTTANPTGLIKNIALVRSLDNNFATAGDNTVLTATVNTTSSTISFSSITGETIPSATTYYYFISANLEPYFATALPTIQLSFNTLASIGLSQLVTTPATLTSTLYTLRDDIAPTVTMAVNTSIIDSWSVSVNGTTRIPNTDNTYYTVTFSEPITTFSDANYNSNLGSTFNSSLLNLVAPSVGTRIEPVSQSVFKINIRYASGSGPLRIDFLPNGTAVDIGGNKVAVGTTGGTYNFALPEPSSDVLAVTTSKSSSGTDITATWADALGFNLPTHYLVVLSPTTFSDPVDGVFQPNSSTVRNVTYGASTTTFTGLTPGADYSVRVYPYSLSPNVTSSDPASLTVNYLVNTPATTSLSSDVIHNSFSYSSDILHNNFTSSEIALDEFTIRDGGAGLNDQDVIATRLSSLRLNVTNLQNLSQLLLYDGSTQLSSVAISATVATSGGVTFNLATPLPINDNSQKVIQVRGIFRSSGVTDNQIISFSVASIASAATGSSQFANSAPTSIESNVSGTQNQIEVVATQIDFTTLPASASVYVPFSVVAEARDVNQNLDLDYAGSVSGFSNTSAFSTANNPAGAFAAGVLNFPTNFQFISGTTTTQLELSASSPSITGTSSAISVLTSFDSRLADDPTYTFAADINYISYQTANITSTTNGYELARFLVQDGDPSKPYASGTLRDIDGAATTLKDVSLELYTGGAKLPIRSIALYVNGVEVQEMPPAALISGKSTTTFTSVDIIAPDEQDIAVSILVTFLDNVASVADNDPIGLRISAATAFGGSNFKGTNPSAPDPNLIGGVNGGLQTPSTTSGGEIANKIEVNATRLDFTTQPPNLIAGINQPFAPPIVMARDVFGLVDLDYDKGNPNVNYQNATISSSAQLATTSYQFALGELSLPTNTILSGSFYYTSTGDGTLTITANGLSSNTGGSIPCQPIRVMDVSATINPSGVLTTNNIKGGTNNAVIFGVTFTADNSSVNEPALKRLTFTFDFPYKTASKTILQNFKVRDVNGSDVTLQGATLTQGSSKSNTDLDLVTVDWGTNPAPALFDVNTGNSSPKSYFLVCDVSVTADNKTQQLTPQLISDGYGSSTAGNIVVSQGSASGNVIGTQYQFASTRPPTLLTTNGSGTSPFNAQLNVDPDIKQIDLAFDVGVWSLDGKIELYKRTTNQKIADLTAINGNYSIDKNVATANPISFRIPSGITLQPDSLYYIKIAKGSSGNNIDSGISDNALNFFGGISYNGALYFKVSSPNPPKLLDIKPSFVNSTVGSFSVKFDQQGTGYFLVLDPSKYTTKPTNADIKSPAAFLLANPNSVVAFNSFVISQVNAAQFVSFAGSLLPNKAYDIWVYAENNALPTPIVAPSPYGSYVVGIGYPIGGTGPTVQITTPTLRNNRLFNQPIYSVCPSSSTLLTEPIILTEGVASDFKSSSTQDFNILLPTGFQFINKPKVTLNGSDFDQTSLSVSLVNNTIATVSYINQGMGSIDNIVISDIYIKSAGGSIAGDIIPFAGNAQLTSSTKLNSLSKLGSISTLALGNPNFDNSFSKDNDFSSFGFNKAKDIIAAIPDNYQDKDPTISGFIRLIPKLENANDYGIDIFSGTAITNDLLSLTSAPLNAPFDITITHTDLNGCVSTASNQYYVYDHNFPIAKNLGKDVNNVPMGTKQALVNPNFPTGFVLDGVFPDNSLPTLYNTDVAGYRLIDLYADLPDRYAGDSPKDTTQIMRGTAWRKLVKQIPVSVKTIPVNSNSEGYFRDYQWDYTKIINAIQNDASKKITIDDYINPNTKPKGDFWKGGSLGKIHFVGRYQSTADFSVYIPLRQEVELFFAPVPIIEFAKSTAPPATDNNVLVYCEDGVIPSISGASPITFNGLPNALAGTSVGSFSLENASDGLIFWAKNLEITTTNAGTNVGGNTQVTLSKPVSLKVNDNVNIFGFTSTGTSISQSKSVLAVSSDFKTITLDYAFSPSNTITHLAVTVTVPGFIDIGNGTATLTPDVLRKALMNNPNNNGYQNIKLGYTFRENISPVSGTGYITLRIAPNPTVTFNAVSQSSVNVLAGKNDAYCENRPVEFISKFDITDVTGVTNTVDKFTWDFGDPLNSVSPNVNSITDASKGSLLGSTSQNIGVAEKPLHSYSSFATYTATHVVTSNYGCQSKPYTANVKVGAVPTVTFDFKGVSTGSDFYFNLTNVATATSANDGIKQLTWDFGDANRRDITTAFTDSVKYNYSRAGLYNASLKLTSNIGCINTLVPQRLLVLPLVSGTKKFDFETDQQWFDIAVGPIASSWARGKPAVGSTLPFELKPENGQGIWKTNLSGPYNSGERSYLFSPAFDISKVAKPLVSFDSYYNFKANNANVPDGVVLQFSTDVYNIVDSRKTWYTLGTYDGITPSGYNWYNSQGLASKPGLQTVGDYGWSGNSEGWKESKHTLSYPIAVGLDKEGKRIFISPEKSKRLVFRFALAGVDGVNVRGNGFALDNFSIGERTRLVVIESFSNLGNKSANEKSESDLLKTLTNRTTTGNVKTGFDQQDVLNINYHIAFPEKDPFNLDNPDDPSARALFYNVKESPRSRLDGLNGLKDFPNTGDPLFSEWTSKYDQQALRLADASIELSGILSDEKTGITIPVKVTALTDLDSASTVLHVGVLERSIAFTALNSENQKLIATENRGQVNSEFVLKKMLPNASGRKFNRNLKANESVTFAPLTWIPDPKKLYLPTNDLYVFAFVQNSKTGEIYQAQVSGIINDPNVVTGIGELTAEDISVFPNPANKEFTIELPSITTQKVEYQLFDQVGKVIQTGSINEGQRSKTINSEDFSNGIYIIQLNSGADNVIRKKVMVFKE